ncbi:MAG: metallophosphoesterase [Syntrophomonadaceae bacterium]
MIEKTFWALLGLILLVTPFMLLYMLIRVLKMDKAAEYIFLAVVIAILAYNFYDNNRIIVKEESVSIPNLPASFEGFTILQISDLHGKSFGPGQASLTARINSLDYDLLALTGDMETPAESFEPFIALLDGIQDKTNLIYVNGNFDLAYNSLSGDVTATGRELEEHGCILLNHPYPLVRDGATLWLINEMARHFDFESPDEFSSHHSLENQEAYAEYFNELTAICAQNKKGGAKTIAITHIPYNPDELEKASSSKSDVFRYDLIIAGHYHGGQIRIPCYGAFYIPTDGSPGANWLPEQKYVSGLVQFNGIQQYVSRGLGSSKMFPLRLFNTPEINLITLRSE